MWAKRRILKRGCEATLTKVMHDHSFDIFLRLLARVEFLVTNNDKEAILAENDLIKAHKPKFNIKLVDDKRHLCLRLDTRKTYPRLEVVRNKGGDRAQYFGPYDSASTLRHTLQIVNKHFQLRTCSDHVLRTRKTPLPPVPN